MTSPPASAAPASGTVMDRNRWRSEAPSTLAASSRSRSTPAMPIRAERTKNGAETNVIARITAIVVNGTEMPRNSNGAASRPRRPNTRSSASPATDGGRTIGRSTTASTTPLPRNWRRASTTANGRPSVTVMTRLIAVVTRLSHRASTTSGVASATPNDPVRIARASSVATGRPRNSAKSPASAVSDRSPHRPRCAATGAERPVVSTRSRERPVASSIMTGAGTRSRPGSPGRRDRRTRSGTRSPRRGSGRP